MQCPDPERREFQFDRVRVFMVLNEKRDVARPNPGFGKRPLRIRETVPDIDFTRRIEEPGDAAGDQRPVRFPHGSRAAAAGPDF